MESRKSPADNTPIIIDGIEQDPNTILPITDDIIITPKSPESKPAPRTSQRTTSRISPMITNRNSQRMTATPRTVKPVIINRNSPVAAPARPPLAAAPTAAPAAPLATAPAAQKSNRPRPTREIKRQKNNKEAAATNVKKIDLNKLSDAERLRHRCRLKVRYNQLRNEKPWLYMDEYTDHMPLTELHERVKIAEEMVSANVSVNVVKKLIEFYYTGMGWVLEHVFDNINMKSFKEYGKTAADDLEHFLTEIGDLGVVQQIMRLPWWVKLLGIMVAHTLIFLAASYFLPSGLSGLGSTGLANTVTSAIRDGNFSAIGDMINTFTGSKSTTTAPTEEIIYDD